MGLELLRKLARPALSASQAESDVQLKQAVLRLCVASVSNLVQQLAARLDAEGPQDWAALQSRLLPGEQLAAQGNCQDLLPPVLLVLSHQVIHLAQHDWCRGLSPLQLHAWRLQEAAEACGDGVPPAMARRLEQLHAEAAAASSSRSSNGNNADYDIGRLYRDRERRVNVMAEAVVRATQPLGSQMGEAAGPGVVVAAAATEVAEACSCRSSKIELLVQQVLQLQRSLQLPMQLLQLWVFNPPPGEAWVTRDKPALHQAQLNAAVGSHVADTAGLAATLKLLGPLPSRADLSSLQLVQYLPGMLLGVASIFADVDADTAAAAVQCASWAQNAAASAADSVSISACIIEQRQNQNAESDVEVPRLPAPPVLNQGVQLLHQLLIQLPTCNSRQQHQEDEASTSEAAPGQQQQLQDQPVAAADTSSSSSSAAAASTSSSSASAAAASTSVAAAAGQRGGWSTQQVQHTAYVLLKMISDDLVDDDGCCCSSRYAGSSSWVQLAAVLQAFLRTVLTPILRMALEEPEAAESALSAVLQAHSRGREMHVCRDIERCLFALWQPMAQAAAAAAPGSAEQQQLLSLLLSFWKLGVTEMVDPSQMHSMWELNECYGGSVNAACTVAASLLARSSHGESSSSSATATSSSSSDVPAAAVPWLALLGRYLATRLNMLGVVYIDADADDTGNPNDDFYRPMDMMCGMRDELDMHIQVVELLRSSATSAAALDGPAWPAAQAADAGGTATAAAAEAVPEADAAQAAAAATVGLHQCAAQLQHLRLAMHYASKLLRLAQQLSMAPSSTWEIPVRSTPWDDNRLAQGVAWLLADLLVATSAKDRLQILADSWVHYIHAAPMQLQVIAEDAVAQLPMRLGCNNPHCTVLAGPSEMQLVGGKSCVCARCKTAG
jgi:hypothetical protein